VQRREGNGTARSKAAVVTAVTALVVGVLTASTTLYDFLGSQNTARRDEGGLTSTPQRTVAAERTEGTTPENVEPLPDNREPQKTVKSAICLLKEAKTSEPRTSTAESLELTVTLSIPTNARECRAKVTVDAPTFSLGKEAEQSMSVVPPEKTATEQWLLDPSKPGAWNIAVETEVERKLVPVGVTTPLGFSAQWTQAGAIVGATVVAVCGVLTLVLRRGR
jgi:hypothetical protein